MKLGQLAASTAEKWGLGTDYKTIRRVGLHIIGLRATVIQRRYDQSKLFPESLIMSVKCTDFISVDANECICTIPGKKAVRTKYKIPKPLLVKDETVFTFVGSANQEESFSEVKQHDIQLIKHRRFSQNMIMYAYFDDYIYVPNAPGFKAGSLRYVPENPLELLRFGECAEHPCIEDNDLMIEGSLEEPITALLDKQGPRVLEDKEVEING